MTPNTDIIISLHSTQDYPVCSYFQKCIGDLEQHTKNYRLVLVEDGCDDEGRNAIEEVAKRHQAILIHTGKQRWFTRAYNLGLRMARTERVVLLNVDTELGPGWLDELYDVWEEAQKTVGRVGLVGDVHSDAEPRRWANSVGKDYVTGHCWLVSMSALYDISADRGQPGIYLDETKAGAIHIHSDTWACWDMNRLGWATVKAFKAPIGHHGGKTWGHRLGLIPSSLAEVDYEYENRG